MREVNVKDRNVKWPLIANRLRQQQTRQSEQSLSVTEGRIVKELNHPRDNTSAAIILESSPQPHEAIFISAIRLTIAIMFGCLFTLILRELGDFNHHFNVLNCEFELEKSSLSNEYDIVCDALTSSTIDTLFNFGLRGVGLGEFNNSGCNSSAVLTVSTITTIITSENRNEIIFNRSSYWGQYTQTQTQTIYPTAPAIDSNDKIGLTGAGLAKFNNVACVFGGVSCENDFYYDVNSIFDDYNYYDNDIVNGYLVCLFLLFFFGM